MYSKEEFKKAHGDISKVLEDYGGVDNIHENGLMWIHLITYYLTETEQYLGKLEGKKLLELGCGSPNPEQEYDGVFEPWEARASHFFGLRVTGIDLHSSNFNGKPEPYNHIQADLTKTKLTEILPEKDKYDIIKIGYGFVGEGNTMSPSLKKIIHQPNQHRNIHPELEQLIRASKNKQNHLPMLKFLCKDIRRLLKDDGKFWYWHTHKGNICYHEKQAIENEGFLFKERLPALYSYNLK